MQMFQILGIVASITAAIISPFVAIGAWKEKITILERRADASETTDSKMWSEISGNKILLRQHDTIIPILQNDLKEMKQDVKEVLRVVKND